MRPLHKLGENNSHTGSLETTHPATILRETEGMEIRNQLSPILSITLKDTVPWKQKATYKLIRLYKLTFQQKLHKPEGNGLIYLK